MRASVTFWVQSLRHAEQFHETSRKILLLCLVNQMQGKAAGLQVFPVAYCLIIISSFSPSLVSGSSILAVGAIGGRSHQYCLLRIGQELAARGHKFTLLASSVEGLTRRSLTSRAFPGLDVIEFDGPPYVGTTEWRETMPRDLKSVRPVQSPEQIEPPCSAASDCMPGPVAASHEMLSSSASL